MRKQLISVPQNSNLSVFGVIGAGKTAGLLIPCILSSPSDWVIINASAKDDVLKTTMGWRQANTCPVTVYDPMRVTAVPSTCWNPVLGCDDWQVALDRAHVLTSAGGSVQSITGGGTKKWENIAKQALACMLHAAALGARTMRDVIGWLLSRDPNEVTAILGRDETSFAFQTWEGIILRQHEEGMSSVYTTLNMNMPAWSIPTIIESTVGAPIDFEKMLYRAGWTHYLIADEDNMDKTASVIAAHIDALLGGCTRVATANGGTLPHPVLVVIDELPSLAPIPHLDARLRVMRARGLGFILASQEIPGLYQIYGRNATDSILNNSGRIIFGGQGDVATLTYFAQIVGNAIVSRKSRSKKGEGGESESEHSETLLGANVLRTMKAGQACLVYRNLPPVKLDVTLYFNDPELKRRSEFPILPVTLEKMVERDTAVTHQSTETPEERSERLLKQAMTIAGETGADGETPEGSSDDLATTDEPVAA